MRRVSRPRDSSRSFRNDRVKGIEVADEDRKARGCCDFQEGWVVADATGEWTGWVRKGDYQG